MKPECEPCKRNVKDGMPNLFGREFMDDLLYKMFDRDTLNNEKEDMMKYCMDQMIKSTMDGDESDNLSEDLKKRMKMMGLDFNAIEKYLAQKKKWKNLFEKIKNGEIDSKDLSPDQLIEEFTTQILDELEKEGYVDLKNVSYQLYPNLPMTQPLFTEKSEKIIAKKVLDEVFIHLKKRTIGVHDLKESGYGSSPASKIQEYDEFQHTYDMLDIQESLICTAIRDPSYLEISEDDLKARVPLHLTKSSNVLLIDSSYSMRGAKFRGGIMAVLALKELLESDFKEDRLYIVTYNHKPHLISSGQILHLRPYGYTDIGQAIDYSAQLLSKEDSNRNIFLITDGEPTSTNYHNLSPEQSALRSAYFTGRKDIHLNIIMLDQRLELKLLCEKMVKLNQNATLTLVSDPLNLKEFIIKTYVDKKKN